MRRSQWVLVLLVGLGCMATACNKGGEVETECVDDRQYFQRAVWSSFMKSQCTNCHITGGEASESKLVLQPETQTGFTDANMAILRDVASYEKNGESILLLKPSAQIEHEGGMQIAYGSDEYRALEEMVDRFENPVSCGGETRVTNHFRGVELMTPQETLRKATVNLNGRLPTASEEFRVSTGGEEALEEELGRLMAKESFQDRIGVIFNDMFLVERYLGGDEAVDLLDEDYYPNARWYMQDDDDPRDFSDVNPEFLEAARMYTNDSVAMEPVELAKYLVRENRPFTEIVTADYMLVNPFTAEVYGVEDVQFEDPLNPNEWRPGDVEDIPHAGVLTSPMWHNRFPTTPTNLNRHRSRMVYWFFLATDVLKLADRPVDPASIQEFNPTREAASCNVCHKVVDPVAGTMQNWNEEGSYVPPEEGWPGDMFPPGFSDTDMPYEQRYNATQWLGQQIASDRRFATSMVHHVYRGLTGQDPLRFPTATMEDYQYKVVQYEIQDRLFDDIAQKFIDSGYNLKIIFEELIMSPYFRAKNFEAEEMTEDDLGEVGELGTGRMLTPEMLDRKIVSVTGMRWADDGEPYLLDEDEYMILYGGIDSDDVTFRMTEPNGIMTGIQYRMANEMACSTVARDFTQAKDLRRYFPYVEPGFVPEDANGFPVAEAETSIKKNIKYLHYHILGEDIALDDPELERTYTLFVETWREGTQKLAADELDEDLRSCDATRDFDGVELPEEQQVTQDPDYTIRAWMAVVSYLLADYEFLYE